MYKTIMDKTLDKCSMCMGYHSNLDCIYKNDIKKEAKCSKCGGLHFDLSCIYSKNESLLG
jgi:hypothetical protein